ncbi:hypothetical protein OS189_00600 [Sulfitobacter sp. F26169L]|uniref:calcium-binding protein n=1 Tax=Sulfitobacter sp. F26169L TaxID=2996015 RepID=UPI00226085D0|nr:hypothetical protein [Sulfitobacter sp. F26169L]MCX7564839.1 hypothetical protein [Sulfitobacter sp. F26169L]
MSPILVMLLASLGPMIVAVTGFNDDDDLSEAGAELPEETEEDPVEMVDVATFIENARSTADNINPVTISRGTDQDEEFAPEVDSSVHHDASGGQDTLSGSSQNDTLAGGDGTDIVEGGDGDDTLFGAFGRETRADDEQSDTLDGGAGDDTLFMGDGDTGTGGDGTDVFVTTQDAVEVVQITDFNVDEDVIAIEIETPEEAGISEQVVEESGLRIELSTGLSLRLEGVAAPVPAGSVQFVPVAPIEQA